MASNTPRHQVAEQAPVYYECPSCGWLSSQAMTLLDQAYELFVSLNNRHAAALAKETDT